MWKSPPLCGEEFKKKERKEKGKKRKKTNYSECYSMRIIYLFYIING